MPWKDQGGSGGGPWGGGGDDKGPGKGKDDNPWTRPRSSGSGFQGNDIDDIISNLQKRLKDSFSGNGGKNHKGGGTALFGLIIAGVVGIWLLSGFYRVQEGELGVVQRFGEMVRIAPPGLRYHIPNPVESVIVQKVATVNTINSGDHPGKNTDSDQNLILTGDENMVHTDYTVLWKIKDVSEYLFTAVQPEATIRVAAESSVREIIGQTTARLALTEGRDSIGTKAQELLQRLLDNYKMGIQIVSVQLQNVAPPKQVIDAFNDVQASLVDADRARNEAEAYRNGIIPTAEGQAQQIVQEAEGYNQQIVAQAQGDAEKFRQVLAAYQNNKVITKTRLYFDTMQLVLRRSSKMLIDGKTSKSMLPYLPLNELKGKSVTPPENKEHK